MDDLDRLIENEFLAVPLRPRTMLIYSPRTAILRTVKAETAVFHGTVLDIGCGFMPYRKLIESNPHVDNYVGMDLENSEIYSDAKPALTWDGETIPLDGESVDCVMATEFLEHYAEPERVLKEIHRVLKPAGKIFATVPFIWNLHEIPHDEYRYTPYALERHFRNVGFVNIHVKALGGWNASLAQMIGLWLHFAEVSRVTKTLLSIIVFPIYALLLKTDRIPQRFDGSENSMFIGLSIMAEKLHSHE